MATVTLRPDVVADPGGGQWVNESVTTPTAASVNDNSDSTFWEWASSSVGTVRTDIGTTTFPANSQIRSVAVRNRRALGSISPHQCRLRIYLYDPVTGASTPTDTYTISSSTIGTMAGLTHTAAPGGSPWTQAIIDRLQVVVIGDSPTGTGGEYFRVYELYVDVVYNEAPTVAVSAPTGTVATAQPPVSWTYSDPESNGQERYRIKVFSADQYGAAGFNPDTSTPTWDSGEVFTSSTVATTAPLRNATTYRAYVKAADVGSSGRYSAWAYSSFTVTLPPLAAPVLSVPMPLPAAARVDNIVAQGRVNLLPVDADGFEGGTDGGWGWYIYQCTKSVVSSSWYRGTKALRLTATPGAATTYMQVNSPKVACPEGELVTAMITVKAKDPTGSSRAGGIFLECFDAGGGSLGSITRGFTEIDGAATRAWVTALTPSGTAFVDIAVMWNTPASGEDHEIDGAAIVLGTANPVDNSGFEEGLTGGVGWNPQTSGTSTVSLYTNGGIFGDNYCTLSKTDPTGIADIQSSYWLACNAGENILFSVWLFDENWAYGGSFHESLPNGHQVLIELIDQSGSPFASQTFSDLPTGGGWVRRTVSAVAPGGTTAFYFRVAAATLYASGDTIAIAVDGVQVELANQGVLPNGGFESTVSNGPSIVGGNWFVESYGPPSQAGGSGHSGSQSARLGNAASVQLPGGWHVISAEVQCAGYTTFDLSFWWQLQNVKQSHVKVTFYDAGHQMVRLDTLTPTAGVPANSNQWFIVGGTDAAGTVTWAQIARSGLPIPAGAVTMRVSCLGGWSYDGVNPGYTWFDDFALTLHGTLAAATWMPGGWSAGGGAGTLALQIQRSVDGGATWDDVRILGQVDGHTDTKYPNGYPAGAVPARIGTADFEAPGNTTTIYRTRALATVTGNVLASSWWVQPISVVVAFAGFWLKDPTDYTRNIAVTVDASQLDTDTTEPQAPHWALNRADPIITAGVVRLDSIPQLTFFFPNDSTWKAFKKLRESGRVLLLQTCYGDSGDEQWYLRLGQTARTSRLTVDTMRTAQPRRVTIDAQAVEAPA